MGLAPYFGRTRSAEEEIIATRGGETPPPQPAGGRRYAVTACSTRLFPARRCFGARLRTKTRLRTKRGCEALCAHGDLDPARGVRYPPCPRCLLRGETGLLHGCSLGGLSPSSG